MFVFVSKFVVKVDVVLSEVLVSEMEIVNLVLIEISLVVMLEFFMFMVLSLLYMIDR